MDRLKLETIYLRALDALMSAVDEYQMQAAIFRLRRAQTRLHGKEMQASSVRRPHRRGGPSLPSHLLMLFVRPPKAPPKSA
jgi:hypothetical protein